MKEDIQITFERDPAARTILEVLTCYPGIHAIWLHRIAHRMWKRRARLRARVLSHVSRWLTGIEIHPAAKIGRRLFIDHGFGVVIGATAEIGNDVTLYHQVTLGGTSWKKEKRHPTIEDNVIVGAGARILGPIRIGEGSRIGANSVVLKNIPPNSTVVGIPGMVTKSNTSLFINGKLNLDHASLPNPVAEVMKHVTTLVENMEKRLDRLENTGTKLDNTQLSHMKQELQEERNYIEQFIDGTGI